MVLGDNAVGGGTIKILDKVKDISNLPQQISIRDKIFLNLRLT